MSSPWPPANELATRQRHDRGRAHYTVRWLLGRCPPGCAFAIKQSLVDDFYPETATRAPSDDMQTPHHHAGRGFTALRQRCPDLNWLRKNCGPPARLVGNCLCRVVEIVQDRRGHAERISWCRYATQVIGPNTIDNDAEMRAKTDTGRVVAATECTGVIFKIFRSTNALLGYQSSSQWRSLWSISGAESVLLN